MVCAESSASFSKTAAFLMSSLGEATERVTSILVVGQACEVKRESRAPRRRGLRGCDAYLAAVQYWYSMCLGVAPLARLQGGGAGAWRLLFVAGRYRAACCGTGAASALASGGTAIYFNARRAQNWAGG